QAYANEVVQRAGGRADQLRQEAQAYKAQVTARADGETQRFLSILKEYEQAPAVTRKRLYLETMETVLTNTRKVLVDIEGNNNIMLLELGELLKQTPDEQRNNQTAPNTLSNDSQNASSPITQSDSHRRPDDARSRGNRQ
ncbi:MAG: protease modulator HflK, partial [Pseudomonadota bacterium]|nr:protease modulator HflK [Pseudomonadota bacterium]